MVSRLKKMKVEWSLFIVCFFLFFLLTFASENSFLINICICVDSWMTGYAFYIKYHDKNRCKEKNRVNRFFFWILWIILIYLSYYVIVRYFEGHHIIIKYLLFLFSVPCLGISVAYLLTKENENDNNCVKVFRILFFSFGILILGIMPIGSVPDEAMHAFTSYRLSNVLLGIDNGDEGTIAMRKQDIDYQMYPYVNADTYSSYLKDLETPAENDQVFLIELPCVEGNDYIYIVPALGITLGRIVGANTETMYLIARFFNLCFSVIGYSYIISKMNSKKTVMIGICLLPIMLQQMSSISYDIPVNLSLFYLIIFSQILFNERDKIKKLDLLLFVISFLIGIQTKSHAYFLIAFLPAVLAVIRMMVSKTSTRKTIFYVTAIIFIFISVFVIASLLPEVVLNEEDSYSILFLMQNPKEILVIIMNTLNTMGLWMISSIFGNYLSYLNLVVNQYLILFLAVILLLNILTGEENYRAVRKSDRLCFLVVSFLETIIVNVGMLLANSHVGDHMVLGMQGRYLYPPLLLFCLSLSGKQMIRINKGNLLIIQSMVLLLVCVNIVMLY